MTSKGWIDMLSPFRRDVSDEMLKALVMHFRAAGKVKASLVYAGVRAGGRRAWSRDDDKRKMQQFDEVLAKEMG